MLATILAAALVMAPGDVTYDISARVDLEPLDHATLAAAMGARATTAGLEFVQCQWHGPVGQRWVACDFREVATTSAVNQAQAIKDGAKVRRQDCKAGAGQDFVCKQRWHIDRMPPARRNNLSSLVVDRFAVSPAAIMSFRAWKGKRCDAEGACGPERWFARITERRKRAARDYFSDWISGVADNLVELE